MQFLNDTPLAYQPSLQRPSPHALYLKRKFSDDSLLDTLDNPYLNSRYLSEQMADQIQHIQISPPNKRMKTSNSFVSSQHTYQPDLSSRSLPTSPSLWHSNSTLDTQDFTPRRKRHRVGSGSSFSSPSISRSISTELFKDNLPTLTNHGKEGEDDCDLSLDQLRLLTPDNRMDTNSTYLHSCPPTKRGAWKLGVSFALPKIGPPMKENEGEVHMMEM
eukprot:TRINITY_DN6414_c0_g1_i1.p1 TRINITY_DN6414_c0_g1~~TRINITY_DN6414_c0_g1_i1.p1  ORF type:complete len:217 (+),score=24.91 TRINITY_DN6414_c0_g1_i1:164-814(+)